MQYSQEHLETMVYAELGGQTECIMGDSKIENSLSSFYDSVLKARESHLIDKAMTLESYGLNRRDRLW